MAMTVGIVGLGAMGGGIALTLRKNGFPVIGFDLRDELMSELEAAGGSRGKSPRDVAERSDVVILSMPNAEAFHAVSTGQGGLGECGRKDLVVADTSTLYITDKVAAAARLKALGITLLDCTVSGTRLTVLEGNLVLFASGDEAAAKNMAPVFGGFTRNNTYVGEFGNASKIKYVINLLVCINDAATGEALAYATKMGLDPKLTYKLVSDSFATSKIFDQRGKLAVEGDFTSSRGFYGLAEKDAKIIGSEAANCHAHVPIFAAALQMHEMGVATGFGKLDTASLYEVYKIACGLPSTVKRG
ncbi:MAG: NAD(P)-dependent oxidoreductase [Alphaproteobacteria bacterium]|nr:NAD(P)-dependent oxidoreductase [Alphaproteobacteria bacterium]